MSTHSNDRSAPDAAPVPAKTNGDDITALSHRWSTASLAGAEGEAAFELVASLTTRQRIIIHEGILEPECGVLRNALEGRRGVCVIDRGFFDLNADKCRALVERLGGGSTYMVLDIEERTKTLETAAALAQRFEEFELARRDVVVAIGGGVCCDAAAFTASIYRRGVQHIKAPTTLLGIVDAGIGSKNAVNFGAAKNRLGGFSPPELSLLDPSLTLAQPYQDFRCGIAEILKIAIARSSRLFEALEHAAAASVDETEIKRRITNREIIGLAVSALLGELALDVYEAGDLRRPADFGHSFSPHIESLGEGKIAHGDAVAYEMLVLAHLAQRQGRIPLTYLRRIERLYSAFQLPTEIEGFNVDDLWMGLVKTTLHRGGRLNMPVPDAAPGDCAIIENLDALAPTELAAALSAMTSVAAVGPRLRLARSRSHAGA